MTARQLAPAVVVLVAWPGALALAQAQGHRGGGGGSHRGGGAVMRPAAPAGGHVSQARHPRAGTGWGSYYGGGRHYGGGSYYGGGRYYGGYYRPYYGYGYRPYYYGGYYGPYYGFGLYGGYASPGFYGSVSIGWPYYTPTPYYAAPYGTSVYIVGSDGASGDPGDRYESAPAPRNEYAPRRTDEDDAWGRLRLEVRPDDATVYVDDQFRGTARAARSLRLGPGRHVVELVRPGFAVERREVEIVDGEQSELLVELRAAQP